MDPEMRTWLIAQVNGLAARQSTYVNAAKAWSDVLRQVVMRLAIEGSVSARPKSLSSFAEKILRKYDKYRKPLDEMTDLWGARIAAYTRADMESVCGFIEELGERGEIEIDWENSCDTADRLKPGEFGYRARHYIVRVPEGRDQVLGVTFSTDLRRERGEIQVTTQLQHVWSLICHDRVYKAELRVPRELERDLGAVNAMLEAAESQFARSIEALDRYSRDFEPALSPGRIAEEIARWEVVCKIEPTDLAAALRLAGLYRRADRADGAAEVLERHRSTASESSPAFLRERGLAYLAVGDLKRGREHLERASALAPGDLGLHCDLGESWLPEDAARAGDVFKAAYEIAAKDPRVLVGVAESALRCSGSAACLDPFRGVVGAAIQECERRVRLGVNLPDAHFHAGRLELMRGRAEAAIYRYARAIIAADTPEAIAAELGALDRIAGDVGDALPPEWAWAVRFLLLGAAAKARSEEERSPWLDRLRALPQVATGELPRFGKSEMVLIIAGGCDPKVGPRLREEFKPLLEKALLHFEGTIIGGGTTAGVSGLAAEVVERLAGERRANVERGGAEQTIRCVGYAPQSLPEGDEIAAGYRSSLRIIIEPKGRVYTPLGPLLTWTDLLLAGVAPERVRVLGFDGGRLAAVEYWIGAALGAEVGIIEDSGREGTVVLRTAEREGVTRIFPLCNDAGTVAAFVCRDGRGSGIAGYLEELGRTIHEEYRQGSIANGRRVHPSIAPWEKLDGKYRNSNIDQAAYAERILRAVGYWVVDQAEAGAYPPLDAERYERDVEKMAELEHGRYCAERLADGWRCGPHDADRKLNPSIVPWDELDEDTKEFDRIAVRNFPALFERVGRVVVMDEEGPL